MTLYDYVNSRKDYSLIIINKSKPESKRVLVIYGDNINNVKINELYDDNGKGYKYVMLNKKIYFD